MKPGRYKTEEGGDPDFRFVSENKESPPILDSSSTDLSTSEDDSSTTTSTLLIFEDERGREMGKGTLTIGGKELTIKDFEGLSPEELQTGTLKWKEGRDGAEPPPVSVRKYAPVYVAGIKVFSP